MRIRTCAALLLLAGQLGACRDLTVPDYNNPSVIDINANPTVAGIAAATQGLIRGTRANISDFVANLGMFGREGWLMSTTGQGLSSAIRDPLVGSSTAGSPSWAVPFRNIRNANLLLGVLASTNVLTDPQKEAVRGFAKTIQAYDLLMIAVTRDRFGAPIDIPDDPNAAPAPIVPKAQVYARIVQLLDQAKTHLQNAGTTPFPFKVTSGLAPFNTPATFLKLNRAIKARADVYTNNWSAALVDINESFINPAQPLSYGAYHVYSSNSGDLANPLSALDRMYAHNRVRDNAQKRADGSLDLRAQRKLNPVTALTVLGNTSNVQYTMYTAPNSPVPWFKNEELFLLRAEAELGLGDNAGALQDINFIRVNSGGLEPLPANYSGDLLTELLYNKFMSLTWEWGHAWIDARHYGRLLQIPVGTGDPRIFDAMPFPTAECLARTPQPDGCQSLNGLR